MVRPLHVLVLLVQLTVTTANIEKQSILSKSSVLPWIYTTLRGGGIRKVRSLSVKKRSRIGTLCTALIAFFRSLVDPFYMMDVSGNAGVGILSFSDEPMSSQQSRNSQSASYKPKPSPQGLRVKTLADLPCSTGG
jgi:hypothetical protein